MKFGASAVLVACASLLFFFPFTTPTVHAATTGIYMAVSPTKGPVGSGMIVTGTGFPPDETISLNWVTTNTTWAVGLDPSEADTNVPEVTGLNTLTWTYKIATLETNSSGAFSQSLKVPTDDNGQKTIEAVGAGFNSSQAQTVFVVEPHFTFSPTSGPVGTPITVTATGLGNRLYAMEYHVLWDNGYIGYMTGVTTHGNGNFTFYATGTPGVHYVTIYNGYPGPAFMNSQQAPASVSITSYDPPLIPFHGTFTITSPTTTTTSSQGLDAGSIFALLGIGMTMSALISAPVLATRSHVRRGIGRLSVVVVVGALALASVAMIAMVSTSGSSGSAAASTITSTVTSTVTQTATSTITTTPATPAATGAGYVPQDIVLRPITTITTIEATTGPRITVTPDVATVGTKVNVTGQGFTPGEAIPLTWTTHVGSHVTGFSSSTRSLRNVTANSAGAFSFTMITPADLEGIHNIVMPTSTDTQANGTIYIERVASISSQEGPAGSTITIKLMGTGWDYQDNIVAVDYDNSFIGYGCGFNENGNITLNITAYGGPGFHSIDLWPSLYLGPPAGVTPAIYRYPNVTPFDGPEGIPAFHFSYYITSNSTQSSQSFGNSGALLALLSGMGIGFGSVVAIVEVFRPMALAPPGGAAFGGRP